MSLHPQKIASIPSDTIRVAQSAFPKGNIYLKMRDELGVFYDDNCFSTLFSLQGKPALAPWRLALITIMQFVEGLTDRQAADAVRGRLDWKYALSLELTDSGFDFSVLSEFRTRLIEAGKEQQLLEQMLAIFQEIRTIVPDDDWYSRYGQRFQENRFPASKKERNQVALRIGTDGSYLLDAIWSEPELDWLRHLESVEILRRIWIQQFYVNNGSLQLWTLDKGKAICVNITQIKLKNNISPISPRK